MLVIWAKENNMRMLFDIKDADSSVNSLFLRSFNHTFFQLILTLECLFAKYNIYDTGIVCSFFPTVVYWIKRQQPSILTGLTWRNSFFSYSDIEETLPRFTGIRMLLARFIDVVYTWCVFTWLPHFLGVDMLLMERRDISP
jgi:glycerophosphoinositol glycerophosphodiesterase